MTDFIVASSASFCNDVAVLDLNYTEEGAELPHLTVALMPKSGSITMLNVNKTHSIFTAFYANCLVG